MVNSNIKKEKQMVHSTTPALEGKTVSSYLSVVRGEAILEANV